MNDHMEAHMLLDQQDEEDVLARMRYPHQRNSFINHEHDEDHRIAFRGPAIIENGYERP